MSPLPEEQGRDIPFAPRSSLTLRHERDGQNGAPQQEQEKHLAYSPAQVIQAQKCSVVGWEGDCAEENLEQENIAPQVLQVESQAVEGNADCKPAGNERKAGAIGFGADVTRTMLINIISQAASRRRQRIKASSALLAMSLHGDGFKAVIKYCLVMEVLTVIKFFWRWGVLFLRVHSGAF